MEIKIKMALWRSRLSWRTYYHHVCFFGTQTLSSCNMILSYLSSCKRLEEYSPTSLCTDGSKKAVHACSVMSDFLWPHRLVAHQALLSKGFLQARKLERVIFPSPGELLDPGIKPASLASPALTGGFFISWSIRKAQEGRKAEERNSGCSLCCREVVCPLVYGLMKVRQPLAHQLVQFSCSVMSDSLWPHGLQHARLPCPSPAPGVYSNSCPSSRWCHPAISSSVVCFSSIPRCFPASGSFPMSQLFAWGGQSIRVSASASVLPMNT